MGMERGGVERGARNDLAESAEPVGDRQPGPDQLNPTQPVVQQSAWSSSAVPGGRLSLSPPSPALARSAYHTSVTGNTQTQKPPPPPPPLVIQVVCAAPTISHSLPPQHHSRPAAPGHPAGAAAAPDGDSGHTQPVTQVARVGGKANRLLAVTD